MSREKQKGTSAESEVVRSLVADGFPAYRMPPQGAKDKGDIGGLKDVVIEVKNHAKMELSTWMNEAAVERRNAGAVLGVVWHKRRGKGKAGDWYVTMDGHAFMFLLHQAGLG